MGKFYVSLLCTVFFIFFARSSAAFAEDRVDLSRGMPFEKFLATGRAVHVDRMLKRLNAVGLASDLSIAAKEINAPIYLVVFGSMSCPDCAVTIPYLEKLQRINPQISTLYFDRDVKWIELLERRTGTNRIPTVFFAAKNGTLLDGAFIEHPEKVLTLIRDAETEEERTAYINEARAGKYDDDVQADLAALLRKAASQIAP